MLLSTVTTAATLKRRSSNALLEFGVADAVLTCAVIRACTSSLRSYTLGLHRVACAAWLSYSLIAYISLDRCLVSLSEFMRSYRYISVIRLHRRGLFDFEIICPQPLPQAAIVIVDPFSSGAILSAQVLKCKFRLVMVSTTDTETRETHTATNMRAHTHMRQA